MSQIWDLYRVLLNRPLILLKQPQGHVTRDTCQKLTFHCTLEEDQAISLLLELRKLGQLG
jgi:hypothetical protein